MANDRTEGRRGELDPLADVAERKVILATLDSFRQYRKTTHLNTTHRRRQNLYALPSAQWKFLAAPSFNLLENLSNVDDAIDTNAEIAEAIFELGLQSFGISATPSKGELDWHGTSKPNDTAKAHSTIRQFYRDWSSEGIVERKLITDTVLIDLGRFLPSKSRKELLIPGAGLARLVFDLALNGYNATGNEISYHQLLASNWILNHTTHAGQHSLYPFATTFTNLQTRRQQHLKVAIPDVHPATAIAQRLQSGHAVGEMNMHAGDFTSTYTSAEYAGRFDAIVSVFFIDTAPNVIKYIDAVRNCLAEGGVWVNIGPLLWHFDDRDSVKKPPDENRHANLKIQAEMPGSSGNSESDGTAAASAEEQGIDEPGSFELTDEEVLLLLQSMGFELLGHEMLGASDAAGGGVGLGYIQDPESMLQNLYRCSHWVVRKKKSMEDS